MKNEESTMKLQFPLAAVAALVLGALAPLAWADQDVTSADGAWKAHAKGENTVAVGKSQELLVTVKASDGGTTCPTVASVVFEMPAHGHGGNKDPQMMAMANCQVHITDLAPSMGGDWRLRLVLKAGGKTSQIDLPLAAK
jgi:hypothetical protein